MGVIHTGNILSDNQSLATASGTTLNAASTNVIALGSADIGTGNPVDVVVDITEAVAGGVSPTLTVKLQSSVDEAFSSPVDEIVSRAYAGTEITKKGNLLKIALPNKHNKYIRLYYTLVPGAAEVTAGKVKAYLERREV